MFKTTSSCSSTAASCAATAVVCVSPLGRFTVLAERLSIATVPTDILSWASPCDIQALRLAGSVFQKVIDGPQTRGIWKQAFGNVLLSIPVHTPFLPSKIAGLAFGGGACQTCRRHTRVLPYSFTLGIWFCSLACQHATLRLVPPAPKNSPSTPTAFPGLEHHSTLPVPLPHLKGSSAFRLYKRSHIIVAWHTFFEECRDSTSAVALMPLVTPVSQASDPVVDAWMKAGEELCVGAGRYRVTKEKVDTATKAMLESIAAKHNVALTQLAMSPTLSSRVSVLSRDLESLTECTWNQISSTVFKELVHLVPFDGRPLPCPFCPATGARSRRYVGETDLNSHMQFAHPQKVADSMAIPGAYRCTLCLKSDVVYDKASLLRHIQHSSH
ncbi:hypothetical protein C8R43DRAFT_1122517 [Mycena crocata]|nr:hypothetical protein C8R43DRAFT_1122517 [Mycena crocata]